MAIMSLLEGHLRLSNVGVLCVVAVDGSLVDYTGL